MKRYKYITSIGVITIILSLSSFSILAKDKKVSDLEKRTFQVMPTFKNLVSEEKSHNFNAYIYELLNGNIFKSWDKYFSDHISLREKLVNTFSDLQNILNKNYINNVLLGEDNYLFSIPKNENIFSDKYLKRRSNYFNELAMKIGDSKLYMVNLPSKDMVLDKKIPIKNYYSLNNFYIDEIWGNLDSNVIKKLDFREIVNDNEELYYKTDHHWNMEGTYKGYKYIMNEIENKFPQVSKANNKDFYDIYNYEKCFTGSDGRKIGQVVKEREDIAIYKYKNEKDYEVIINNREGKFFYEEHLDENKSTNDYMIYLNGENAEVVVKNLKNENNLKIVMIGDSMDNPLVPLMSYHFNELYSYDLRSYEGSIIEKINNIKPDIVMLIGLSDGFINESSKIFNIK